MRPVKIIEGRMAPLDRPDIDTDQIIPKQFLKRIERSGFGPFAFYDWAHTPDGNLDPDFILNRPEYAEARVLVTGPNFGCGSSREHAPWALQDRGFDAIISPSFADIFYNNCTKIGLLPVRLDQVAVDALVELAKTTPEAAVRIDLERRSVEAEGISVAFEIDDFVRECLLEGLDDIALTEKKSDLIAAYESSRPSYMPTTRMGG